MNKKDNFNKTPLDYIIENNLIELRKIITGENKKNIIDKLIIEFNHNNIEYILFETERKLKKYYVLEKKYNGRIMYSNYTDNLSKITAYSSKISNRIINIISNIKKLTGGKIKKYKIENNIKEICVHYSPISFINHFS